jgi:hypothetical protein
MPNPLLLLARTSRMWLLNASVLKKSIPSPFHPRTDPLKTAMLMSEGTTVAIPSSEPATPSSSKPFKSIVTPLAAISMPCFPLTPVMLPVR